MLVKRLRIWFLSLFSLALIPSAFAAFDFTEPFAMIFSIFNDLFVAAEPYVNQDGFQRFMYWILIFIIVFFSGQTVFKGNDDESKKRNKRLVSVIAAVFATAGAFAASPEVMRGFGSLVAIIIPFGLLMAGLFYWVFRTEFLPNHPRVKHIARFLVYMLGVILTSYVATRVTSSFTSNEVGNFVFQILALFFTIMMVYELVMIFIDGAAAVTTGANHAATMTNNAATAATNVRDAVGNLFRRRPANIAEYTAFSGDITPLEIAINNLNGINTQLNALRINLVANINQRGNPQMIHHVGELATQAQREIATANTTLTTIISNAGFRYLPAASQLQATTAGTNLANMTQMFLNHHGWLQTNMYP